MSNFIHTPDGSFDPIYVVYVHHFKIHGGRGEWRCLVDLFSRPSRDSSVLRSGLSRTLSFECKDEDDAKNWADRILLAHKTATLAAEQKEPT